MLPDEFDSLMEGIGYFEHAPTLAVAVSGGADSMALLLLADHWTKKQKGRVVALTVDHGLRKESADEARQVATWCKAHTIPHHILTWTPPALTSAIQDQAREARYRLLTDWCREHHVLHLLTAHHQGDQAETLIFRLSRGSGTDGLAAMPAVSIMQGVRLIRPLLGFAKEELLRWLSASGQQWIDDPSNRNSDFTRIRIRNHLANSEDPKMVFVQASELTARLGAIRRELETHTAERAVQAFQIFPQGYGIVSAEFFDAMEEELAERALANFTQALSGEEYPPRTEKLSRLRAELMVEKSRSFSGLLFHYQDTKKQFLVTREMKAITAPIMLQPGETGYWDNRFAVSYTGTHDKLSLGALGADGRKHLKDIDKNVFPDALPNAVIPTLPALWRLEEPVFVPHIGFRHPDYAVLQCSVRFKPAKALAGAAFFSMNKAASDEVRRKRRKH